MTDPVYISFASPVYEQELHGLRDSLDRFGLEHDLTVLPSLGSWELNANMKPFFIGMMLMKHQRPVVWLDADARVEKKPDFSEIRDRLGVALTDWWKENEILSGTIYIPPSAREFVQLWIAACMENPGAWDQVTMKEVIYTHGIPYVCLRPEYCAFDRREEAGEVRREDVVVWHGQRSRQLRQEVNSGDR